MWFFNIVMGSCGTYRTLGHMPGCCQGKTTHRSQLLPMQPSAHHTLQVWICINLHDHCAGNQQIALAARQTTPGWMLQVVKCTHMFDKVACVQEWHDDTHTLSAAVGDGDGKPQAKCNLQAAQCISCARAESASFICVIPKASQSVHLCSSSCLQRRRQRLAQSHTHEYTNSVSFCYVA